MPFTACSVTNVPLPGWTAQDVHDYVMALKRDVMGWKFDAEAEMRDISPLSADRMKVGRIMVSQIDVVKLRDFNVKELVDRIFEMTDAEVRAFLEMHALDRTVNG